MINVRDLNQRDFARGCNACGRLYESQAEALENLARVEFSPTAGVNATVLFFCCPCAEALAAGLTYVVEGGL